MNWRRRLPARAIPLGSDAQARPEKFTAAPARYPWSLTSLAHRRGHGIVFLNPEGKSAATAAIDLLKAALARNLRTIVYCRSRRMTELISLWAGQSGAFAEHISAYRAGFLPEERRSIEARMASGELLAVVSTSALELGIDIGGLDVCILVGYPGFGHGPPCNAVAAWAAPSRNLLLLWWRARTRWTSILPVIPKIFQPPAGKGRGQSR